jgi:outer membrane murein-binding lipoprotein Lpp
MNTIGEVVTNVASALGGAGVLAAVRSLRMKPQLVALGTALETAIKAQGEKLEAKIDRLDAKIDAQGNRLDAKIDAQGEKLEAKIDRLDAKIDAQGVALRAEISTLSGNVMDVMAVLAGLPRHSQDASQEAAV